MEGLSWGARGMSEGEQRCVKLLVGVRQAISSLLFKL